MKKTVRDVNVGGKTVLVRADYNVPLREADDGSMEVADDTRIQASLATLRYLREQGAGKIVVISHLGRPELTGDEEKDEEVRRKFSLEPVAERLTELMPETTVRFVDAVRGEKVREAVKILPEGGILVLENLRFEPGEKANAKEFAEQVVGDTGAELFVQDGFGVVHREQASTVAMAEVLPAVMGLLVEREIEMLQTTLEEPERPFVVVIGGAKVADKQPLIEKFLPIADRVLVGGKIAADGYATDDEKVYVAEDFDEDEAGNKLDIGPVATGKFVEALRGAKTVLWNGVLGKVEDVAFATGSEIVAKVLGENPEVTTVICGGDTVGFVMGLAEKDPELKYDWLSTGGGAALALLAGERMPGVEVLGEKLG